MHRGTVLAAAFWFHPGTTGATEARVRVLAAWRPGATVWALAGGHLLRLATPCKVAVDAAPGLPLVLESGVLTSAPLASKERERLAPPPGAVVLVHEGVARLYVPGELRQVDLGSWLDVSGWQRMQVKGLGAPPPALRHMLAPLPPPTRESFGPGVPALAPEAQRMLALMEGRGETVVARREGWFARLRRVFSRQPGETVAVRREGVFARLRRAFGASFAAASETAEMAQRRERTARVRRAFGLKPVQRGGLFSRLRQAFGARPEAAPGSAMTVQRQGVLSRLLAWLGAASAPSGATNATQGTQAAPTQAPPPGPSAFERMKAWMLQHTPLGALVGRRKGDYLRNLLEMFEEGRLDEALRHAIPLGRDPDPQAQLALGVPGPREQLRIQPRGNAGSAQVFGGGPAVFEALRERYRTTFRRLEREGRIDEAAFVLAELLNAAEEAVSFLERHGRLRLAAELAEGRELPAGLVVRQWLLAKDVARAVAIARRGGAFADAVLRLEKSHPREAEALRLLWAESLAEAGNWARAVEALWPVTSARHLARAWVERGVRTGGVSGAKLLVHWMLGFPDGFGAARGQVEALLSDTSAERAPERLAFATELLREEPSDAQAALLVPTFRALMRDRVTDHSLRLDMLLRRMRAMKEPAMAALRTDLPMHTATPAPGWSALTTLPAQGVTLEESDAGAHAVHDAVVLPGRRVLLALGEAGARLVDADGRTLAWFDVPAFSLVVSTQGDRALALARRGDVWRLSRLDLVARRASRWCDMELGAWAPTYDGDRWFVAVRDAVLMVDALADDLRSLWRVPQVGGAVLELAVDEQHLSFLVLHLSAEQDFHRLERWGYALEGGPTLRHRADVECRAGMPDIHALTADGEAVAARSVSPEEETPVRGSILVPFVSRPNHVVPLREPSRVGLVLGSGWSLTRLSAGTTRTTHLRDVAGNLRASVEFTGTPPQVVRLTEEWFVVHDLLGRVVWLDLHSGEVHRVPVA
ncbi:bpX6 domain-containing protein [Corallococcus sicarius]|uniref:bpX6 domain-containing protein n=1 Tax=Corallococcus sicarius TaxID=2316726 RepID=UPI001FC9590B|nr:bpX6 domain-containing protein [Corallococcus sicarius]